MTTADFQHLRLNMVKDVVLVEVISKDLRGPDAAQELGRELATVAAQDWAHRILVDLHHVRYLSSTGFAVLVKLASQAQEAGRQVKLCRMDPDVRIGADIIGLGKVVEIHDTEDAALAAFARS